jgi:hypothetical protein
MRDRDPRRTVLRVRIVMLVVGSLIVLGAAVVLTRVSDDEGAVQRERPPTRAELEAFARLELPTSTRALRAEHRGGIDDWMQATFEVDRADVEPLLASAGLRAERVGDGLRAGESEPGYERTLTIRFAGPGTASVLLTAFTT